MGTGKNILHKRAEFTEKKLASIRQALRNLVPGNVLVAVFGSYGRLEACAESDLDFVPIMLDGEPGDFPLQAVHACLKGHVDKEPARGGAFGSCVHVNDLLVNIGGNEDTNRNITRRMLYLLEGNWLANEDGFREVRTRILEKYIPDHIRDHQIAMLLLNDIIRYWRTMAVDYAHKTREKGKPWAIRNIKLVFSRKLIYASGLFTVAMTADRSRKEKISILEELLSDPPLRRIERICGQTMTMRLKDSYCLFLEALSDPFQRRHLEKLLPEERYKDHRFRKLKNEGHRFGQELMRLFEQTFPSSHPIRHAVVF